VPTHHEILAPPGCGRHAVAAKSARDKYFVISPG
jgi:hypothetical protein